jgi:hypothetical protein
MNKSDKSVLPAFCDYSCPHAAFAPNDASGACRREQAVFCSLAKKYNNKNARCIAAARTFTSHKPASPKRTKR